MEPTQALVKSLFDYRDGLLYWKIRPSHAVQIGDMAGGILKKKNCYRYEIGIKRKQYRAARLIFLWHHGWLPKIVDHRDRDTLNNYIDNLRPANKSQNNANVPSRKNSTSKYLGVSLDASNKWKAQIKFNNKVNYLGLFKTEEAAAIAYNEAAKKHHGEFANLNIF